MGFPTKVVTLALRGLQFVWAIIIIALIGNIVAMANGDSAAVINYNLFLSAFVLLMLFYLVPAAFSEKIAIHPVIVFIADLLLTILTFCGAVALPSKLHAPNCGSDYETIRNPIAKTSNSMEKACREAQASTAFLWFMWFTFLISTILSGIAMTKALKGPPRTKTARRPSQPSQRPSMSQV